jgi:hypothetical protein
MSAMEGLVLALLLGGAVTLPVIVVFVLPTLLLSWIARQTDAFG